MWPEVAFLPHKQADMFFTRSTGIGLSLLKDVATLAQSDAELSGPTAQFS